MTLRAFHPQGHPGGIDVKPRRFRVTPAELFFPRSRVKTRPQHPGANPFLRQIGGDIGLIGPRADDLHPPDALTPEEKHQQRQRHTDPQSGPRFPAAPHCRSPLGAYFPDAPALVRSDLLHCGKIRRPALAAQGAPSCAAHILQRDFFLLHQRQKPFQIQTAHRKGTCQQGR